MSELPTNDRALINFLQQHRPPVPEATPDLEDRILAAIDTEEDSLRGSVLTHPALRTNRFAWISSLIAAGFTLLWIGSRAFNSSPLSPSEQAQLEGFLESNWYGALQETQETSWLTLPDDRAGNRE